LRHLTQYNSIKPSNTNTNAVQTTDLTLRKKMKSEIKNLPNFISFHGFLFRWIPKVKKSFRNILWFYLNEICTGLADKINNFHKTSIKQGEEYQFSFEYRKLSIESCSFSIENRQFSVEDFNYSNECW